jgi:hypothetical protein
MSDSGFAFQVAVTVAARKTDALANRNNVPSRNETAARPRARRDPCDAEVVSSVIDAPVG